MAKVSKGKAESAERGSGGGFSAAERAAMKERARELKAEKCRAAGERALLEKVQEMPPGDKAIATGIHEIVTRVASSLEPKTWYGMPAYARDGKVVLFVQSAAKFGARYATLGFSDQARLDDGQMWPTSFALKRLGPTERAAITALVAQAANGSDTGDV